MFGLYPKRHFIGVLDKISHYGQFLHQVKDPFYDQSDIFTNIMRGYNHYNINAGIQIDIWEGQAGKRLM